MNTNRTILVVVVIAILAALLSACSGNALTDAEKLYAGATANGSVTRMTINASPRPDGCQFHVKQHILNQFDKEAGEKGIIETTTTDAWLDQHMKQFPCIAPKKGE